MTSKKDFILGLLLGTLLSATVAYAAQGLTLVNGGGTEIGTTASPLYVQGV